MKIVRLDTGKSWEETTVSEEEADELDIAIAEFEQAKRASAQALVKAKQIEERVLQLLDERDEKTHVSPFDGGWQVTKVVAERITIDEIRLHNMLGDHLWEHVTVRKFDKDRLEHAVSLGLIRSRDVVECSAVVQNTPYVRLTRHREQEPEEPAAPGD